MAEEAQPYLIAETNNEGNVVDKQQKAVETKSTPPLEGMELENRKQETKTRKTKQQKTRGLQNMKHINSFVPMYDVLR